MVHPQNAFAKELVIDRCGVKLGYFLGPLDVLQGNLVFLNSDIAIGSVHVRLMLQIVQLSFVLLILGVDEDFQEVTEYLHALLDLPLD